MDSQKLNQLWDGWMASLSTSYAKTQELVNSGKMKQAAEEFRAAFVPTVKKMYSEVALKYPARFSKIDKTGNWCDWSRNLYVKTREAENALRAEAKEKARDGLAALRVHFDDLHRKADTMKANDYIYALREEANAKAPDATKLKDLMAALEKAQPSAKAKAQPDAYAQAKSEWSAKAGEILKDGKVSNGEIEPLRQAAEAFYQGFGMAFE